MPRKKDIILTSILLIIAIAGLAGVKLMQSEEGATVTITISGQLYGTYSLNSSKIIEIDEDGYNRIVIEDGYVYMESADCPDQYCVNHSSIHYSHETIICLPHELVVEISGGEVLDIDVVVQ